MRRRVVYARAGGVALSSPHDELGRAGDGVWAAVDDETLLGWIAAETPHRLVWLARADYDAAVRALPADEIARVVHLRLERWTPQAAAATMPAMIGRERELAAAAASDARLVDAALARLERLYCEGSFAALPLDDQLRIAVADEVRLVAEEEEAGDATAAARRRAQAGELARARAGGSGLPLASPWRVYAVEPASDELALLAERQGWSLLRDGARLIVQAPRKDGAKMPALGVRVTLLSVDGATFGRLSEDTPAQRARDLAELESGGSAALAADRRRLIDELRVAQAAQKRALAAAGVTVAARQRAADEAELVVGWQRAGGGRAYAAVHADAVADARLYATLAQRAGYGRLAGMLDDERRALDAARGA